MIGLLGTVEETPKDFAMAKPYLVQSMSAARASAGGTVGDALSAIFQQAEAQVVVLETKKGDRLLLRLVPEKTRANSEKEIKPILKELEVTPSIEWTTADKLFGKKIKFEGIVREKG